MISTTKLSKILGVENNFRLSQEDRAFLRDLAKVKIIDLKDANQFHYSNRQSGAKQRLDKLASLGILTARDIQQPGRCQFRTYEFSNEKIAKTFGGSKAIIGSKRSALHEVLSSKVYFAKGRPDSFKTSSDFKKDDLQRFYRLANGKVILPDAMYSDDQGELVIIEADSGHYTKRQVLDKQLAWRGIKQIWSQPSRASAKVAGGAEVYRFS